MSYKCIFTELPFCLSNSIRVSNPINIKTHFLYLMYRYVISLSGALAILNVVPCYALDGQWILLAFIELSLRSTIPNPETRGLIYTVILLCGTMLLAANVANAMWVLFF